jgi:hypothetical protein
MLIRKDTGIVFNMIKIAWRYIAKTLTMRQVPLKENAISVVRAIFK